MGYEITSVDEPITLKCSNCNKKLINVCVTDPFVDKEQKIRAKCYSCTDEYSFSVLVKGSFSYGGVSKKFNENTFDEVPETLLDDVFHDDTNGMVTIVVSKANG